MEQLPISYQLYSSNNQGQNPHGHLTGVGRPDTPCPQQYEVRERAVPQQSQIVPLLQQQAQMGLATVDTQTYFHAYQSLLAQFKGNVDCRVIPSKKNGDTFTLTKAGAERICRFFGLNYQLLVLPSTKLDFANNIFYYAHECQLSYQGKVVGNGFGNCNNRETKYNKSYSPDILNTLDKMSQKRAFTSAVLFTTGGSRFFGQKVEDLG
ncbi:MAG: hypothetical protein HC930_01690 [Hydrococcus sp. SU_1_0]|nr:hypothetical protein [Hydrococcus sp. SU_1_0]NJO95041.1 hypothetical protein [Pleurocapsa sp. CRU_1_2]